MAQQPETHKILVEGLSGSGHTVYMVCTVINKTGNWLHIERFASKEEAECWLKWA
jgi:hypothetical protein